jgi:TPR repeat protein
MSKNVIAAVALTALCGLLHADELGDAQRLWEKREFKQAFQQFSVLAERGVPAAQLQLGEMYGFGEGTAQDVDKAAYWLNRAKAAGQPEAAESLVLVQERQRRKAEIEYYTTHYDGAALRYDHYGCVQPTIPAVSKSNADIKAVNAAVTAWTSCYGRFVQGIGNSQPATGVIPPDLFKLMSNEEYQRASVQIENKVQQLIVEPQRLAETVMAENKAWKSATEKYVLDNNASIDERNKKNKIEYDVLNKEIESDYAMRQDILRARSKQR